MGIASKMAAYAAPSHPPPQTTSGSTNPFSDSISTPSTSAAPAAQADPFESAIPDEAPPAYTAAAPPGDAHLAAGPARMDFSGPPPMSQPQHPPPNRLENQITGVGIGYGPRRDHGQSSPHHSPNAASAPSMPPRHPSHHQSTPSSGSSSSLNRPSPQGGSQDTTPTQVATPGRPLLRNGQLLVYPKGFMCHKCGNTGYKNADPSNPHDTDWRKYGKPFTGALAHSYTLAPSSNSTNASTQTAQNFQQPLPLLNQPPHQAAWRPQGHGVWDHPGNGHPPPPPPMQQHHSGYGHMQAPPPPPMIMTGSGYVPANAVVVKPGDPRLGGQVCFRCGGQGRELDWLGFDSGKCWQCRGVGRVF